MNYLLRNKPKNERDGKILGVITLFIALSLFGFLFPNFSRMTAFFVARPIWSIGSVVTKPFGSVKNYFVSKNSLIRENLSLENEINTLKLKEVDYDLLSKENENLKNQMGRASNSNRIISRVLSKPPRSPYDTLVIDVGSSHNISIGDKVYSAGNIIIGKVSEVTGNTSIVELFSKGDLKQESVLLRTGASFTLIGAGGANFELEVPKDTDVLWGDVFVYPGLSSSALGAVYFIDDSSKGSFKTIYLRIPGNVFSVQWVFVESQ